MISRSIKWKLKIVCCIRIHFFQLSSFLGNALFPGFLQAVDPRMISGLLFQALFLSPSLLRGIFCPLILPIIKQRLASLTFNACALFSRYVTAVLYISSNWSLWGRFLTHLHLNIYIIYMLYIYSNILDLFFFKFTSNKDWWTCMLFSAGFPF